MMAGNSRGMMRPHNSSRAPSFIVIGLLVVIFILSFNSWNISIRNTQLTRELEDVSNHLRTLTVKKLSIERRSQDIEQQYNSQSVEQSKKIQEIQTLTSELSSITDELSGCREELTDAEAVISKCRNNFTGVSEALKDKEDEIDTVKEQLNSDTAHFEETLQSLVNNCSDTYAKILGTVQLLWGGRGLKALGEEGINLGQIKVDDSLGRLSPENQVVVPQEPDKSLIVQQPALPSVQDTQPPVNLLLRGSLVGPAPPDQNLNVYSAGGGRRAEVVSVKNAEGGEQMNPQDDQGHKPVLAGDDVDPAVGLDLPVQPAEEDGEDELTDNEQKEGGDAVEQDAVKDALRDAPMQGLGLEAEGGDATENDGAYTDYLDDGDQPHRGPGVAEPGNPDFQDAPVRPDQDNNEEDGEDENQAAGDLEDEPVLLLADQQDSRNQNHDPPQGVHSLNVPLLHQDQIDEDADNNWDRKSLVQDGIGQMNVGDPAEDWTVKQDAMENKYEDGLNEQIVEEADEEALYRNELNMRLPEGSRQKDIEYDDDTEDGLYNNFDNDTIDEIPARFGAGATYDKDEVEEDEDGEDYTNEQSVQYGDKGFPNRPLPIDAERLEAEGDNGEMRGRPNGGDEFLRFNPRDKDLGGRRSGPRWSSASHNGPS